MINLAELVCNEIKFAITFDRIKSPNDTQFYLDQLTEIMEVCGLKSKKLNPKLSFELIVCEKQKQWNVSQTIKQQNGSLKTKPKLSQKLNKKRLSKSTTINSNRVHTYKTKRKINHFKTD